MSPLFSSGFPSGVGKDKDTYTDDSKHGNYDARTDQSLLIQNKLTRQKTEPRTKSSLKVMDTEFYEIVLTVRLCLNILKMQFLKHYICCSLNKWASHGKKFRWLPNCWK